MDRRRLLQGALGGAATAALAAALPRMALAAEPDVRAVTHDPDAPVLGNPAGDVTIVEFFDYQCPYCRKVAPVLRAALARDRGLRLVLKDVPVFGPASVYAARMGLAASGQGRYPQAYGALIGARGRLTEAEVDRSLTRAGFDIAALKAAHNADAGRWQRLIQRNMEQAEDLGFRGTPAFVIGRTLYGGAIDAATLDEIVAATRAEGPVSPAARG
ncbi:DsbA family protein [Frigidibacter sp. MR17.14]|uniref:DsbA family protein n=1 Tax=Frigidibacter sp. MR17.14 TaxID=3126509 RepID=UPI003012A991